MSEPVWNQFLTERDKQVFATSGYGARQGFGKRPAVLVVDVNYNFCGDKPEPISFDTHTTGPGQISAASSSSSRAAAHSASVSASPCHGISKLVSHRVRQSTTSNCFGVLCCNSACAKRCGTSTVFSAATRNARSAWCAAMRRTISASPAVAVAKSTAVWPLCVDCAACANHDEARSSAQRDLPLR